MKTKIQQLPTEELFEILTNFMNGSCFISGKKTTYEELLTTYIGKRAGRSLLGQAVIEFKKRMDSLKITN